MTIGVLTVFALSLGRDKRTPDISPHIILYSQTRPHKFETSMRIPLDLSTFPKNKIYLYSHDHMSNLKYNADISMRSVCLIIAFFTFIIKKYFL